MNNKEQVPQPKFRWVKLTQDCRPEKDIEVFWRRKMETTNIEGYSSFNDAIDKYADGIEWEQEIE